jgi:hypothetical protein
MTAGVTFVTGERALPTTYPQRHACTTLSVDTHPISLRSRMLRGLGLITRREGASLTKYRQGGVMVSPR